MTTPTQKKIKTEDGKTTYIWHDNKILENIPSWQVYGFCLMPNNLVPLVRDRGEKRFTLPGGRIDEGESPKEALIREFLEEAQFLPENIKLLGSLEVIEEDSQGQEIDHHQQIRFVCQSSEAGNFIPCKNGSEVEEIIFIKPEQIPDYIGWTKSITGEAQYKKFLEHYNK